jgi:hypothetical protein
MDVRPTTLSLYPHLDFLVQQSWHLHVWDDRYSKGIWAAIFPNEETLADFCDATSCGDDEAANACTYMLDVDWTPAVVRSSVYDALMSLDSRLGNILGLKPVQMMARNYSWHHPYVVAVDAALLHFSEQRHEWAGKGNTTYVDLPARWQDANAFFEALAE